MFANAAYYGGGIYADNGTITIEETTFLRNLAASDADADGYGDPDTTATACEQPSGYLSDASDCDDADSLVPIPATHP